MVKRVVKPHCYPINMNFWLIVLQPYPLENLHTMGLGQVSSTRGPRAACGPRMSFVRPGKGISQNTMHYEY